MIAPEWKKLIDAQAFKDVVDGEVRSGQFKGTDIFTFSPICTHWFAANQRLKIYSIEHPLSADRVPQTFTKTTLPTNRTEILTSACFPFFKTE